MASFFLELHGGSIAPNFERVGQPGEISVLTDYRGMMVTWGDPSIPADHEAIWSAVTDGRTPDLSGRSVLMIHAGNTRATVIIDRFGLYPAVVSADAGRLVAASDLAALHRNCPETAGEIQLDGLVSMLAFNQCIETGSVWKGVRHLTGAAVMRWDADQGSAIVERESLVLPNKPFSPKDALDRLVDAVDRRLTALPDAMIPLSGGLDSRLLLACAVAAGHRPETFSYGAPESADIRIAADLAATVGSRFHAGTIEFGGDFGGDFGGGANAAERIAEAGGGEVPIHHGHAVAGALALPHLTGRPVLTGTGSETFRSFYYDRGLPGMSALGIKALKSSLQTHATRWVVEHFAGDRLASLQAVSRRHATALVAKLTDPVHRNLNAASDLARGLDATYLDLRVARFVVGGQQLLNRTHPRLHPFLDPSVVEALSGLPTHWKLGGRFHRWAIEALAPDLAAVTWDKTDRPMSEGLNFHERWPGLAARLGLKGAYAKAGAPIVDYRPWAASIDRTVLCDRVLDRVDMAGAERDALRQWIGGIDRLSAIGALSALDLAASNAGRRQREAA